MEGLARLLAYDHWANGEALGSLERAAAPPPPRALRIMAHVLAAHLGWLDRLGAGGGSQGFWPGGDLDALRARWRDEIPPRWRAFLADAARSDPARRVAYRNSRGDAFVSTVADVVTHVAMHSAYHRGQVASEVRAAGGEPAVTDFVHATRTGLVP